MYVIIGAAGKTGRVVAEKLLESGKPVRVVGRNLERLQPLVRKGAQAVTGSVQDLRLLTQAFEGATAVYAMLPPNLEAEDLRAHLDRIGEAIAGAVREMRVPCVVNLSSIGAQLHKGVGPVNGLHAQEKRLDAIPGTNALHLRPGFFMENLYGFADMLRAGFIASPLEPDLHFPWIATRDIGAVTAQALMNPDFEGKVTRELHGQRDLTLAQVVKGVGAALEKPDLKLVTVTYEEAEKGIRQAGISADVARNFVEMYRAINEGRMKPVEPRSARNTTPTSIEEFAKGFAAALGRA